MGFFKRLKKFVKGGIKTVGKVVGNVARGAKDVVTTVKKQVDKVVEEISGARLRREAAEDLQRAANEQAEAQAAYDKQAAEVKRQTEEQRAQSAQAAAAQAAATQEAQTIEAETAEQTRLAELEAKRTTASGRVQAQIDAATAARQAQIAEQQAMADIPEDEDDTGRPAVTRTPIATPVPGGYGGTEPGAINPTGLNI